MATQSPRSQLSTRREYSSGSDSSRAPPPTRPREAANAGQRSPSALSPPRSTSSPPPSGSASTRRVRSPSRAEVTASAQASVDAPAPPRPPITPTVRAGLPMPSATSAMRSTSHGSPSGSIRTWSAPIWTARFHTPGSSWSRPTSTTPGRRAAPSIRCAASSPTSTSGAAAQPPPDSGTPWWTSGVAPAAAHRRSRSSRRTASSVTMSGRPGRSAGPGGGSWVTVPVTGVPPSLRGPRSPCGHAIPKGVKNRQAASI